MKYEKVVKGLFLSRPNRFIAMVDRNGTIEQAHVKNTGRCKELLVPGAEVYLEDHGEGALGRKTRYSLIAVEKRTEETGALLINMDSQAPNQVVMEALEELCNSGRTAGQRGPKGGFLLPGFEEPILSIRRESSFCDSRFDFYIEGNTQRAYLEVKGVTLEDKGIARFPDAPTMRGIKHLKGLEAAVSKGFLAYVMFLIQMKGVRLFEPNDLTHKAFGDALRHAAGRGVRPLAWDCAVETDSLRIGEPAEIRL